MKEFDESAARQGARVCTRQGYPARILCYDMKEEWRPIVALVEGKLGREMIFDYNRSGKHMPDDDLGIDLMMADDDYKEKLERGEYNTPEQTAGVWLEPHMITGVEAPVWTEEARIMTPEDKAKIAFLSPFDESYWRKMYAGMAMQGIVSRFQFLPYCCNCSDVSEYEFAAGEAIKYADALIEELKKEK